MSILPGDSTVQDRRLALREEIRQQAHGCGFDAVAFAALTPPPGAERLRPWLEAGYHGGMTSLAKAPERRADPATLAPEGGTLLILGVNTAPAAPAMGFLRHPHRGGIAVHARGEDYHAVLRRRMEPIAAWLEARCGPGTVLERCVDTAPLMEKPLAALAGMGWQGRNTVLISRRFGAWLLLGELILRPALPPDPPGRNHCGTCDRCITACPTGALRLPGILDVGRCLSFHTIESVGPIPLELRRAMGNRIFGCDDCLAVCPFNRFAPAGEMFMGQEGAAVAGRNPLGPELLELARLDRAGFGERFRGSGVARIGWRRLMRNVTVALGNWGAPEARAVLTRWSHGPDALIREHAAWGLAAAERPMEPVP